jgi:hypothetical protein
MQEEFTDPLLLLYESSYIFRRRVLVEVFDTLKADATFLLDDAKRGSIFPFSRVDERSEEEIDQFVITSEFLRFMMVRAMDAMKSEAVLFVRDKQTSYDLFNVLRSI